MKTRPKPRRWRKDAGDWVTGASPRVRAGIGGIVCAAEDGGYTADVYHRHEICALYPKSRRPYRRLRDAQRAVERYLDWHAR